MNKKNKKPSKKKEKFRMDLPNRTDSSELKSVSTESKTPENTSNGQEENQMSSIKEVSMYLEDSIISNVPELTDPQLRSLAVFMVLEILTTFLTISLAPLHNLLHSCYKVEKQKVKILRIITVVSCVIAFYPTNAAVAKFGVKNGLILCLSIGVLGAVFCCFIGYSYNLFLLGYAILQICVQVTHSAKGNFVNMYYSEKNVSDPT